MFKCVPKFLATGISVVLLAGASFAADETQKSDNHITVGAGAGTSPDYLGSDDYIFAPLPFFDMSYEGFVLRSNGFGVEADILSFEAIEAGPIVRFDSGRDDNVKDKAVKLLPEVDGSVEVGGFVGAGLPFSFIGLPSDAVLTARIEFTQGLNGGHEGAQATGSLGVVAPLSESFTVITSVSTTYMSSDYADAFFSISPAGSAASGLANYDADAGFRDVGVSMVGNLSLTDNISANALVSYTRLIGDAADSPIVKDRGDENQFVGGIGLSYSFN